MVHVKQKNYTKGCFGISHQLFSLMTNIRMRNNYQRINCIQWFRKLGHCMHGILTGKNAPKITAIKCQCKEWISEQIHKFGLKNML